MLDMMRIFVCLSQRLSTTELRQLTRITEAQFVHKRPGDDARSVTLGGPRRQLPHRTAVF